ncbi:MAG: hypothetical protein HY898_07660 [Deltaproteobacteria bacterium]|nr:hypothetical protein [Deltaproteobacteria bacterium]
MKTTNLGLLLAAATITLAATTGCTTESFCFANCGPDAGENGGAGGTEGGVPGDGAAKDGDAQICFTCNDSGGTGGGSGDSCTKTNNGTEICDGLDNDCNGQTDENFDLTKDPHNCGICSLVNPEADCAKKIKNAEHPLCTATAGQLGKCDYDVCLQDFWDLDGDRTNGCEYYCVKKGNTDSTCDNVDDDCNGKFDDGINKCSDGSNCGKCGRNCQGHAHATGKCVTADPPPAVCDDTNTHCEIAACEAGWIDANALFNDGCEYQCTPTKRTDPSDPTTSTTCTLGETGCGIEYCDGLDNDCDGKLDAADPDMIDPVKGDPLLGKDCQGSATGECGKPAHKGITKCVQAAVKCSDDNTGSVDCTNDPNLCNNTNTPYCIDSPTPPGKVCGTKVWAVNTQPELCNNLDDNCDGVVDGPTSDSGAKCGSNVGICSQGISACSNGALVCSGQITPQAEICNGADDDCDGVIDGVAASPVVTCGIDADCASVANAHFCMVRSGPSDKVCAGLAIDIIDSNQNPLPCDVPQSAPLGWDTPCKAGVLSCAGGAKICGGSVKAQANKDSCGHDLNCNGLKDPDFDLQTDVKNCGTCGNDCAASLGGHIAWTCVGGTCTVPTVNKCAAGYIDCDGNANDCEKACTFYSNQELCNGFDDNCDCNVDEMKDGAHPNGIVAPSPSQICGVSPAASDAGCTTGVAVTCSASKWTCTFPAGYCNTGNPPTCSATQDICDGQDNNCNGSIDENFKPPILAQGYLGQACLSDDNVTPKHGLCQQSGTFKCDGTNATACMNSSNVKIAGVPLACGTGPGQSGYACDELCDGKDNDCDGVADEPYIAKGNNAAYWVKPAVVNTGTVWVYANEASRPSATNTVPGTGNGWWRSSGMLTDQPAAPSGVTLDKTPACSATGKIPWFNVTGLEAQHVCKEMGGRLCKNSDWTKACRASATTCNWAFDTNCTTFSATTTGPCNLNAYDFDPGTAGVQHGLLPTAFLANCHANWAGTPPQINDLTGNLRELTCGGTLNCTAAQTSFVLMGGAFNTSDPTGEGARCDFTFYNVDQNFKLYDVGFRCCFDSNPG